MRSRSIESSALGSKLAAAEADVGQAAADVTSLPEISGAIMQYARFLSQILNGRRL